MIEQHLQKIEKCIALIREDLKGKSDFTVTPISDSQVKVTHSGDDIEYYMPGEDSDHEQWKFKASKNYEVTKEMQIGGLYPGTWWFRSVPSGEIRSAIIEKEVSDPIKYHGFWDHDIAKSLGEEPEFVTVAKTMSVDGVENISKDVPIIAYVGGFQKDESDQDWKKRLENKWGVLNEHKDKIKFVLIKDEPYLNGIGERMDDLVGMARDVIPLEIGMSVMRHTILSDNPLPKVDWMSLTFYPFRNDEYGFETKQEFQDHFRSVAGQARQRYNGKFFVVGQGFYTPNWKYAKPDPQSPFWLQESMGEEGIDTLLWYTWEDKGRSKGVRSMPDLLENIKKVTEGSEGGRG